MKNVIALFLILFVINNAGAGDYPINLDMAAKYFDEIKEICDSDSGELWKENLWAPILLIDSKTRFVAANQPDNAGLLKKVENVYIGYFPKEKGIANSTIDFGNENWMMVTHPLPEDSYNRNQLCIHELYHRLQNKLKLEFGNYYNDHMDKMDARILIKLEWLALEKAINSTKGKRNKFLTDALVFRKYRRELYPGKDSMENRIEIHEGLAEYTGHKLCSNNNEEFKKHVLEAKNKYWEKESYVRSFAYYSGILYGYVLDLAGPEWRREVKPGIDLGDLVRFYYKINLPKNSEDSFIKAKKHYDYVNILIYESDRDQKRQEVLKAYRQKFTKDTILTLEVPKPNVIFNPNNLIPLDTLGTVYPTFKIIAEWGILQVNDGGCLFDWKKAIVSARNIKQTDDKIVGDGWEIELNKKWRLTKDISNYKLVKIE